MKKYLQDRVAIVTGAGSGLGRAHALELARQGARVVVNDVAGAHAGSPASAVVDEIVRNGGTALAAGGDVTDYDAMQSLVGRVMDEWQRVDILVNNAGILRDKSFSKMSLEDFRQVLDVHLMGSVHCIKAVWEIMREQRYGRIVMTTSSSGLYGNFGQSNYSAAKMALVGLMQTLALEGAKHDIRVNCLAPTAATAMTEGILLPEALERLSPAAVSPAVVALVGEDAPTRCILLAGAGGVESANITMTRGIVVDSDADAAQQIRARMDEIRDRSGELVPGTGFEQCQFELAKAGFDMQLP
ncbi:SDR family NAD(P)-dependent oxidoreductase [Bordetella petrii]|uniref:Probable short-chain type dehydrogenase/reductase n=1 Tax=Bordetella petrii (strain ATCC BAA-461 / DSM 12804 / CCUG 43448 / CIP 107267 / Se-1111R) TaxID=340100 RepID=A9I630_BORPD|nr:SDR family NAD(P)-dependent oxidoreductase [Bordetella petrii]CAP44261.1 probable short-chain type dehydrogenase/reductase [Bordetella petrii]